LTQLAPARARQAVQRGAICDCYLPVMAIKAPSLACDIIIPAVTRHPPIHGGSGRGAGRLFAGVYCG
jgi:hypothetical protein